MRGLVAAVFVSAFAVPDVALAEQARGLRSHGAPTLATAWPARHDCSNYSPIDLSVDDRVTSVEWRGSNGASLVFELPKPAGGEDRDVYRLASDGTDCHVGGTSCIVYRPPVGRILHVRPARASQLLPADFKAGAFDKLVLHGDVQREGRPSRKDRFLEFGLRLILHCEDTVKPSLAWACDARSCVARSFRDNVKMREFWKAQAGKEPRERSDLTPYAGPYRRQWRLMGAPKDLTRLICMRGPSGRAEAVQAARKENGLLVCDETMPFAEARPLVLDVGRDLLHELDMVLEEGCAGACAARIDQLRAVARALAVASDLHLAGVRAAFHDSHDEFGYGTYPSVGWVAALTARAGSIEIACARHRTFTSMGLPDGEECRLTVYTHGRRLADYTPDWGPYVELPDGGAVRMLDLAPSNNPNAEGRDKIVIIGSALEQRAAVQRSTNGSPETGDPK